MVNQEPLDKLCMVYVWSMLVANKKWFCLGPPQILPPQIFPARNPHFNFVSMKTHGKNPWLNRAKTDVERRGARGARGARGRGGW